MKRIYQANLKNSKITLVERHVGEIRVGDAVYKNIPEMYRVDIESSLGENSLIRHRLWLPADWNGIFVGVGNGGFAGRLGDTIFTDATRGYAVAQTDMGTSRLREGTVTTAPKDMWLDYGYRATHDMTLVAKEIIRAFYGRDADYSYFVGASAGGLQALTEAQRYPEDYDGISAGVPSNNAANLTCYFLHTHISMCDEKGTPYFTNEEKWQVAAAVYDFFLPYGQSENGYISYGWVGEDTVARVIDFIREKLPHLTELQIEALVKMYTGPIHKKSGKRIFSGVPFGAEINCDYFGEGAANFDFPWFKIFFGEGFENRDFDFSDHYDRMLCEVGQYRKANNPDLSAFRDRGGKLFVFSGGADPYGPWADAMNYYNRVCEKMSGYDAVSDFFRYFLIPGRDHGAEGYGINRFTAGDNEYDIIELLRAWRERGEAPDFLNGSHMEIEVSENGSETRRTTFTRRLYPYRADKIAGVDFPPCCDADLL